MYVSRRRLLALAPLVLAGTATLAQAAPMSFTVECTGEQQVPPVQTSGKATARLTYNPSDRVVTWNISYSNLSSEVTMAHFHGPAEAGKNAPVLIWLTKKGEPAASPITGQATLTPEQAQQFTAGEWYINVHTKDHPNGEVRGQVKPPKTS